MALWDKLRFELDRAGKAAQSAFDEGRLRLEAVRARRQADRVAQNLGYTIYRAHQSGSEPDPEICARLERDLAAREAEVARYEAELSELRREDRPLSGPVRDLPRPQPDAARDVDA